MTPIENPLFNLGKLKELSSEFEEIKYSNLLKISTPRQLSKFIEVPDNYPEQTVYKMIEESIVEKDISEYLDQYFKNNGVQL